MKRPNIQIDLQEDEHGKYVETVVTVGEREVFRLKYYPPEPLCSVSLQTALMLDVVNALLGFGVVADTEIAVVPDDGGKPS